MRIVVAITGSPNEVALPESRLWGANLVEPLRDMGHEVMDLGVDFREHMIQAEAPWWYLPRRGALSERIVDRVRRLHAERPVHLFLTHFNASCIEPSALDQIRALGVVTVNFFCNAVPQFHLVEEIAPHYDACAVPERAALDDYRRVGAKPIHIPMAANPNVYRPFPGPEEFDVTFVGQMYAERPFIIHTLLKTGLAVRVWGPGWAAQDGGQGSGGVDGWIRRVQRLASLVRRDGPWSAIGKVVAWRRYQARLRAIQPDLAKVAGSPLSDEDLVRMYSRSRISLGFGVVYEGGMVGGRPTTFVRLRDFEAPMSGACYLTEFSEERAEYYEPDREMVFYRSVEELVEKARDLLAHPERIQRIRARARARSLACHTWQHRYQALFAALGLPRD